MSALITDLIARFGLVAVFLGCVAEGETAAIIAGFLAHQDLVPVLGTLPAVFLGALAGDTAMFLAGRRYADRPFVARLRTRPGFAQAHRLVRSHPDAFVFFNRYVYGMRTIGAVTAGLSDIPFARYVAINAISCLVWTVVFVALGYFVGLGVETFVGTTLRAHEKLIVAGMLLFACAIILSIVARRVRAARVR